MNNTPSSNQKTQEFQTMAVYGIVIVLALFCIFAVSRCDSSENDAENVAEDQTSYSVTDFDINIKRSYGTTHAECYVAVKNTGDTDLYLDDGTIDVETLTGKLVAVLENVSAFPQIIAPGETGYYFANDIISDIDTKQEYKISYDLNIKRSTKKLTRLSVSDVALSPDSLWGGSAVGRITNNTSATLSPCYIAILLFDENQKFIGCEYDAVYADISPNATKSFDINFMNFEGEYEDIAGYKVYAYPYQYQFD